MPSSDQLAWRLDAEQIPGQLAMTTPTRSTPEPEPAPPAEHATDPRLARRRENRTMKVTIEVELERTDGMNVSREAAIDALREHLDACTVEVEFERADGDVSYSAYEVIGVEPV